jgi:hypothetical protein
MSIKSFNLALLPLIIIGVFFLSLTFIPTLRYKEKEQKNCYCYLDSIIDFGKYNKWYYWDHQSNILTQYRNNGFISMNNSRYLTIAGSHVYYFREESGKGYIWTKGLIQDAIFYDPLTISKETKMDVDSFFRQNNVNFEFDSLTFETFPMIDSMTLQNVTYHNVIKYKEKYYKNGSCIISKPTFLCSRIGILALYMNKQKMLSIISDSISIKHD